MAEVLLIYRIISHAIYQSLDSPTQAEQTTVVSSDFVLVVQLRWKYLMSFHCWFLVPVVAQVVPVVVQLCSKCMFPVTDNLYNFWSVICLFWRLRGSVWCA
jgi:hypothetical protein